MIKWKHTRVREPQVDGSVAEVERHESEVGPGALGFGPAVLAIVRGHPSCMNQWCMHLHVGNRTRHFVPVCDGDATEEAAKVVAVDMARDLARMMA